MPKTQTQLKSLLNAANIPALSMAWGQGSALDMLAGGVTDNYNPSPVDHNTLFQAASLSKPVSAAIVLDLVSQGRWDLDTPLAAIADYGPPELKNDTHYQALTTRMVIGQCSGLPNWFYTGETPRFIKTPGEYFNYSGVAFDFLKELIEKKLGMTWEALAQEFFSKAGMESATFKQLPESHLKDKQCTVARAHLADGTLNPETAPIDSPEVPAASLLTTARDYVTFLQYAFNNPFLRKTLLTEETKLSPDAFPETPFASRQIQWGLGMGIFTDEKNKIAFHWGNNLGADGFCAIHMTTGNSVACFVNSVNGPNVFQALSEPVVGDMGSLFKWLSIYSHFNAEIPPKSADSLSVCLQALHIEPPIEQLEVRRQSIHKFKSEIPHNDKGTSPDSAEKQIDDDSRRTP